MTMTNEATPGDLGSNAGLGLVERLRQQFPDVPYHRDQLHRDAADEIERLRFELGYAQGQINQAEADKAKAVSAERERCAKVCEEIGALEALEGEDEGSAALVRVADRMADLCAAAIRKA